MDINVPIQEYFRYHPPQTTERQQKHDAINWVAMHFAEVIEHSVLDPECKKAAIFAVLQAKMFANQGITIDELRDLKLRE